MADFFTEAYFNDLLAALNASPEFKDKTARMNTTVLMVNKDKDASFLLNIVEGVASGEKGNRESEAQFTFIGDQETWAANHRGEAPMEKLVMTGKLKFKGSIPKIMGMRAQLTIIDNVAQGVKADDLA